VEAVGAYALWARELLMAPESLLTELAATIESLGFAAVWVPGGRGDAEPVLSVFNLVLSATERLVAGSGVVNIWTAPATATATAARRLLAQHPGRLLLGLGVGHREVLSADEAGGTDWTPLQAMGRYLDVLDELELPPRNRVLAALGDSMLRLASRRAAGAHPYHGGPEHTRRARRVLGPGPLLVPEQTVVLEHRPRRARAIAREHLALYLTLGNYVRNWLRTGFTKEDVADGGSDRLVDEIVAWGDDEAIARRLQAHLAAGADQVAVQILGGDGEPPVDAWRHLASIVTS
jgi:probable F420-dependent oxidoreductase